MNLTTFADQYLHIDGYSLPGINLTTCK